MVENITTPEQVGRTKRYHASPGLMFGTWMVIVQSHPGDHGYGVQSGLPTREAAECEASRLNHLAAEVERV